MELRLIRKYKKELYTIGKLYVDGQYFCDTVEDKVRDLKSEKDKVYGKTAIPAGVYDIVMNVQSPKYLEKAKNDDYYKRFNGYIPRIKNVPFFNGVLIHPGTTADDSYGCVIIGENKEPGKVVNSRATFSRLWNMLSKADGGITIKIE